MSSTSLKCKDCGNAFGCGHIDGARCWCDDYPPVMVAGSEGSACICPECLHREISTRVKAYAENITAEEAMRPNAANRLPQTPLVKGIDYYQENGNVVMTRWYLLRRGYCCESGCRHCPYGYSPSL